MPNRLALESSPYLLQHQNNPVDWYPWCEEAWDKARRENKLVLVSVGYSACHWCHVMEHESFENETTARIMNEHYVCIKVDREERPDVDQVYMSAVQLMSGQGGWPLNCFTLPDGRPLYGGTYFPNMTWNDLLVKLNDFYRNDPGKAEMYAAELTDGLHKSDLFPARPQPVPVELELISKTVKNWKNRFDRVDGGPDRAPKFPLPNNYQFLMHYASATGDKETMDHVLHTLDKMADGGIYDQLGGGFARYAVDSHWKVPHFEKMLYDNAQLVSLYAKAFQYTGKDKYAATVHETLGFIQRELTAAEGVCYAALDADSEGIEGNYYTWTLEELNGCTFPFHGQIDTKELFKRYYSINEKGYWEHGRYILLRSDNDALLANEFNITTDELNTIIADCKKVLLKQRSSRIAPGLDHKIILSWNALMITAWCDAYDMCGEREYLIRAQRCAEWLCKHMLEPDGRLHHSTVIENKAEGPSFLDDYAFLAQAMISLYRSSFDESRLNLAVKLVQYAIAHFTDNDSGSFWFTSDLDPGLITRKQELQDNVIPASTSVMARVLFELGYYMENEEWIGRAKKQLEQLAGEMTAYGSAYSNWLQLALITVLPFHETVISGPDAVTIGEQLRRSYLPSTLIFGDPTGHSTLSRCIGRFNAGNTFIHVCSGNSCSLPVTSVEEALRIIRSSFPGHTQIPV